MSEKYEFDESGLPRRLSAEERRKQREEQNAKAIEEAERKKELSKGSAPGKAPRRSSTSKGVVINDSSSGASVTIFDEQLPNGGQIHLMSPDEVHFYRATRAAYEKEYPQLLKKPNDALRLSQLLTFEVNAYRMSQRMMGQVIKYDQNGNRKGVEIVDPAEVMMISERLPKVQDEIRRLEVALKIDKKTRDGSGEGEIRGYMENLKKAAIQYEIHLSGRYKAFDNFVNELRWRIRVLGHDEEDRNYHGIKDAQSIIDWASVELQKLEEVDKEFAKDRQALWVGKI